MKEGLHHKVGSQTVRFLAFLPRRAKKVRAMWTPRTNHCILKLTLWRPLNLLCFCIHGQIKPDECVVMANAFASTVYIVLSSVDEPIIIEQ